MSTATLELNDCGIVLTVEGVVGRPSPGYARFSGGGLSVGEQARAAARLEPLNVANRFWHDLDERPLASLPAAGRSNADLAYQHLLEICDTERPRLERLVALVPASIQQRQLMLLLGIAREAQLPLVGFVDAAAAEAAASGGRGRFIYVDQHLHQTVLTAIEVGNEARRERYEQVARAGLVAFTDLWMKHIAGRFIARTRFDPLHEARSEQNLFEVLPDWLRRLEEEPEIDAEITLGGETHRVPLTREEVEAEAQPLYAQILLAAHRLRRAGHATAFALSSRAARLPGLVKRFAEFHDCDVLVLPDGAAARVLPSLDIDWTHGSDNAPLLRAVPLPSADFVPPSPPQVVKHAQAAEPAAAPSHALYRGQGHRLSARPLVIGTGTAAERVDLHIGDASAGISRVHCSLMHTAQGAAQIVDHSRYGTWLNDERVVGRAPLRAGDHLRIGTPGVAIELIAIG